MSSSDNFFSSLSAEVVIYGSALFLATSGYLLWYIFRDPIEDLLYGGYFTTFFGTRTTVGDISGVILWTVAYYFISPLQLLLLFLGRFETDRPSDWILYQIGILLNQPVDETDYEASKLIYGLMFLSVFTIALLTVLSINVFVGGATWSVSTGIGACMAASLFEVGRPRRLNIAQKQELDKKFEDFVAFAESRLQKSGSCHESEIFQRFRQEVVEYRDEETMEDLDLRFFVKQWAPQSTRTSNGFFKKVSLRVQQVDNH